MTTLRRLPSPTGLPAVADRLPVGPVRLSLEESRPVVQGVFAGRFVVGAVLSTSPAAGTAAGPVADVLVGLLGWVAATVAIYLLNGITDVRADRVNGSTRPIASGRLPLRQAKLLLGAYTALSLAAAASLGPVFLGLTAAYLVLGAQYSIGPARLKSTTAGAGVSVVGLGLLTYLAGAEATGAGPTPALLAFALSMSAWMGGVGAVTKDFSDVAGDAVDRRRTAVMRWGEARTAGAVTVVAALIAAGLLLAGGREAALLGPGAVLAAGAAALGLAVLRPGPDRRRPYRIFMRTQYAANAVLLLAVGLT